jgi:C1A family cysteine protease
VSIQANSVTFMQYQSGVINSADCGTIIDHSVLAVGFTDTYYIVKNSWGTSWGESGYVRIGVAEGKGICGINEAAAYPTF